MANKEPTTELLKRALEQLNTYELPMLRSLANILAIDQGRGVISNALLESFLIHVRLIIEFLYKDGPYKDNVLAGQYFKSYDEWKAIRPSKTKLLEDTQNDAHKYLAHLTFTRLEGKKTWAYLAILKDIEVVLKAFSDNLPKEFDNAMGRQRC